MSKSFTVKIAKWKSLRWPCLPFALRLDLRVYWNYLTRRACSRVNIDLTSPSSLWIKGTVSHPQRIDWRFSVVVVVGMAFHIDVKISPNQLYISNPYLMRLTGGRGALWWVKCQKTNQMWTMSWTRTHDFPCQFQIDFLATFSFCLCSNDVRLLELFTREPPAVVCFNRWLRNFNLWRWRNREILFSSCFKSEFEIYFCLLLCVMIYILTLL